MLRAVLMARMGAMVEKMEGEMTKEFLVELVGLVGTDEESAALTESVVFTIVKSFVRRSDSAVGKSRLQAESRLTLTLESHRCRRFTTKADTTPTHSTHTRAIAPIATHHEA